MALRITTSCALALVLGFSGTLSAQSSTVPTPMSVPQLHVGIFTFKPDGTRESGSVHSAGSAGENFDGLASFAPCSVSAISSARGTLPASASDAWTFSGTVQTMSADGATVQLTWRRVRRDGQDANPPPETNTLTLQRGNAVTLERITKPALGTCAERTISVDVVFATAPEIFPSLARAMKAAANVSTIRGVAGVAGGTATGGQGEVRAGGVGRVAGAAAAAVGGGGGFVGEASVSRSSSATGGGVTNVRGPMRTTADLWLVLSGGDQSAQYQVSAQVFQRPTSFVFSPFSVRSAAGVLNVTVQGTIESGQTPEGEWRLYFSANRTILFTPANGPARDSAPVIEGSTKTSVPLPGPDDVLSFEMPALRVPGGATLPQTLSIRVRLTSTPIVPRVSP